jgi:hypothetical protein
VAATTGETAEPVASRLAVPGAAKAFQATETAKAKPQAAREVRNTHRAFIGALA